MHVRMVVYFISDWLILVISGFKFAELGASTSISYVDHFC